MTIVESPQVAPILKVASGPSATIELSKVTQLELEDEEEGMYKVDQGREHG